MQKTFLYMGGVFLCDFVYCCDIERYDVQLTKLAPIYNIIYGFITLVAPYLYLKNGHNGRDVLSLRHITKWLVRPQCITSKLTNYDHPINPDFSSGCHGLLEFFGKRDVYKPYPHRHES